MRWRTWLLIAILPSTIARAGEPNVDDVVKRARAVADRKPQHVTCKMSLEVQLYDKAGKLEHDERREGDGILDGDDADLETTRAWRDGKPLSAEALKSEHDKAAAQRAKAKHGGKSGDDFDLAPLASKNADG